MRFAAFEGAAICAKVGETDGFSAEFSNFAERLTRTSDRRPSSNFLP